MATRMEMIRAEQERRAQDRSESASIRLGRIAKRQAQEQEDAKGDRELLAIAHRRARLAMAEVVLVEGGNSSRVIDASLNLLSRRARGCAPTYTSSVDAARLFVAENLPGFFVTSGLCELSGHASIGPDYNGRRGKRLRKEWGYEEAPCDWSEDLSPGNGPHRECFAILACAVRALAYRLERSGK